MPNALYHVDQAHGLYNILFFIKYVNIMQVDFQQYLTFLIKLSCGCLSCVTSIIL